MMRWTGWIGLVALAALVACPAMGAMNQLTPEEKEDGWKLLFNGTNTDGLKNYQGPEWKVQGGELIGPSQANGWIGTLGEYDNFHLKLEYWVDKGDTHESNSGVFIRADKKADNPWVKGYEIQISLEDENNPTGSIYGRVPTSKRQINEKKIAPAKQWNAMEIRCQGPRIQVWVNGHPLQDAYLHVRDTGVIGVQQHHPGVTIKYRNLKVKTLKPSDAEQGWRSIVTKDLEGWTKRNKATWEVDDEGALVGSAAHGHIYYTKEEVTDLEMRAMIWCKEGGNSGFYIRANPPKDNPDSWPAGCEAQVDVTDDNWTTGCIYGIQRAADLITLEDRWFSMRVRYQGRHIQTWVNGQKMVDFQLSDDDVKKYGLKGFIALQCHDNDPSVQVKYKDLYVREVK